MAKKKTKKRQPARRSTRRGRMNGIGGSEMQTILGVFAGVALSKVVSKATSSITAISSPMIQGAIFTVGGIMVPKFIKNDLGKGIGYGMVAAGGATLMASFGILNGIGSQMYNVRPAPANMMKQMAGTDTLKAINGSADLRAINGTPASRPVSRLRGGSVS